MTHLLNVALVGSARHANYEPLESPCQPVLSQLQTSEVEDLILVQAGTDSLFKLAAQTATHIEPKLVPLPAQERPEKYLSEEFTQLLITFNHDEHFAYSTQALRLVFPTGLCLAPHLIHKFLEKLPEETPEGLAEFLGHRGQWLAALFPKRAWVEKLNPAAQLGPVDTWEKLYEETTFSKRDELILQMRKQDPTATRELCVKFLPKEKADIRQSILQQFRTHLSAGDVNFLESFSKDRSEYVVKLAARMCALLPTSQIAQRMEQRAAELFKTGKKRTLESCAPEKCPEDWLEDGVNLSSTFHSGARGKTLEGVLHLIPPQYWLTHYKQSITGFLALIKDDEYEDEILQGLGQAIVHFQNIVPDHTEWAFQIYQRMLELNRYKKAHKKREFLFSIDDLPQFFSSKHLKQVLEQAVAHPEEDSFDLISRVLKHNLDLSAELSLLFCSLLKKLIDKNKGKKTEISAQRLHDAVLYLHHSTLTTFIGLLEQYLAGFPEKERPWHERYIQQAILHSQMKLRFHELFQEESLQQVQH